MRDIVIKDELELQVPGQKLASSPVNDLYRGTEEIALCLADVSQLLTLAGVAGELDRGAIINLFSDSMYTVLKYYTVDVNWAFKQYL